MPGLQMPRKKEFPILRSEFPQAEKFNVYVADFDFRKIYYIQRDGQYKYQVVE